MARFKLPIFAVVVVALALAGLMYLGGRMATLSGVQTTERLAWGQALFETSLRLAQSYRTSALAIAAADPSMNEAVSSLKDAAPTTAVAEPVKKAVSGALERLPSALRRPSYFLVGNDRGVAIVPASAGGSAEVRSDPGAFRLSVAGMTGPQGTFALADGKLFAVAAAPLRDGTKNIGWLGAAFPLDDQFAAEQSKDLAMPVTLVAGSNVVGSSLPAIQRAAVAAAKDGAVAPLSEPPAMGPYFTAGASLATAKSFALEGADGARVVLVSEAPLLASLADYQKRGIFALLAVLAAALAFFFVGKSEGEAVAAEPRRVDSPQAQPSGPSANLAAQNAAAEAAFNAFRESTGSPEPVAPSSPPPPAQVSPEPPSPFDEPAPAAPVPPPMPAAHAAAAPPAAAPAHDPFGVSPAPFDAPPAVPPPSAAELAEAAASSDPTAMVSNPYDAPVPLPAPPNPMVAAPLRPAPPAPAPMAERPFESVRRPPSRRDGRHPGPRGSPAAGRAFALRQRGPASAGRVHGGRANPRGAAARRPGAPGPHRPGAGRHRAPHRHARRGDERRGPALPRGLRSVRRHALAVQRARGRPDLRQVRRQAAQEPRPARGEVQLQGGPLPGLHQGRQGGAQGHTRSRIA
ncbi:MAG: hypothetical protein QM765_21485 [Myxococcales bacterium]